MSSLVSNSITNTWSSKVKVDRPKIKEYIKPTVIKSVKKKEILQNKVHANKLKTIDNTIVSDEDEQYYITEQMDELYNSDDCDHDYNDNDDEY